MVLDSRHASIYFALKSSSDDFEMVTSLFYQLVHNHFPQCILFSSRYTFFFNSSVDANFQKQVLCPICIETSFNSGTFDPNKIGVLCDADARVCALALL